MSINYDEMPIDEFFEKMSSYDNPYYIHDLARFLRKFYINPANNTINLKRDYPRDSIFWNDCNCVNKAWDNINRSEQSKVKQVVYEIFKDFVINYNNYPEDRLWKIVDEKKEEIRKAVWKIEDYYNELNINNREEMYKKLF